MGHAKQPKRAKQARRQKKKPQRSCIVCRQKSDKRQLTRIVKTPDGVIIDQTGKQSGRGAYLCAQQPCWDAIEKNGRILNQALKIEIKADDIIAIVAHKPVSVSSEGRT